MATTFYNLDAIQTDLKRKISENRAFLEAWENVSFPVKKDGKPFSVLSKNIDGAKYSAKSYAMQAGENELTIYTWSSISGYIHDSIDAYNLICYMKDEKMLAKTENYMPKVSYLNQVYKYDLDDIKNAIASRVSYLKDYIDDLEKQLEKSALVYRHFRDAYASAMNILEKDTEEFSSKTLYYAVADCIKDRFPYC